MKFEELKNVLSKFWDATPISSTNIKVGESICFTVKYFDETNTDSLKNRFSQKQNYGGNTGYFIVDAIFPFKNSNFTLGHIFKLDFKQLQIEVNKILNNDEKLFKLYPNSKVGEGVFGYDRIAIMFEETYLDSHKFLACFNGNRDDYKSIAELLIRKRGMIAGKEFGF
jgi:hypothetical protein